METADSVDAQGIRRRSFNIASNHDVSENDGSDYDSDASLDFPLENAPKKTRRPGTNAFRQQRLRSFNPVFTASTVIPILIGIAIVFVPLGAGMWYAANTTQDLKIEYSQCEILASSDYWLEIPSEYVSYGYKNNSVENKAQWRLSTDDSQPFEDERRVCNIQFEVTNDMKAPIYLFYRLENFHANHRRFSNSFSEDQIQGRAASTNVIKNTAGQNCQPLSTDDDGKKYYPCGLIANSMFNDTFTTTLTAVNNTGDDYEMTEKGIAWATNRNRFRKTEYHYSEITPPPFWAKKFPDGYNETNVPDISAWPQFQNWMQASGLPGFNKLALRNDDDVLSAGIYEVSVGLHFPVLPFDGKKFIFISQRSVIGGKNYFLGISWIVGGGVCFVLGLVLLAINMVKPRKTGDVNLLSWNREEFAKDEKEVPVN